LPSMKKQQNKKSFVTGLPSSFRGVRPYVLCAVCLLALTFVAASASQVRAQSPSDFFQALQSQNNSGQNQQNQNRGAQSQRPPNQQSSPFSAAAQGQNQGQNQNLGLNLPVSGQPPIAARTPSPQEIENQVRAEAFAAASNGMFPMNPDEIRKILALYDQTRQATETPIYPYPKPEVVVETVSMDPGAVPPIIKVATGHVATVNVLDVTGNPWPIQDITWAGNFEIVSPEEGGHVVRITPLSEFAYGNMSVRLVDLQTPITFTIRTTRDVVYYRFDARLPEYGPYAQAPLIDGGLKIVAGSNMLGTILDGIAPDNAERLTVEGVDGRTSAYKLEATTYLRTPLTLLSPGWTGSVSSADGMRVYELSNAPVVLLSDGGQVVRAKLGAQSDEDDIE